MWKRSGFSVPKLAALLISGAVVAATGAASMIDAWPASADATVSATASDNAGGCVVHTAIQYDETTNSATLNVSYHNGNLFYGCRETSGGQLLLPYGFTFRMPIHNTIACSYFDPTCLHDVNQTFTDYNVLPSGMTLTPNAVQVKTVAGYASTVW